MKYSALTFTASVVLWFLVCCMQGVQCIVATCPAGTNCISLVTSTVITPNPSITVVSSTTSTICYNVIINPSCSGFNFLEFSIPISGCSAANLAIVSATVGTQTVTGQFSGNEIIISNGGVPLTGVTGSPVAVCTTVTGVGSTISLSASTTGVDVETDVCGLQLSGPTLAITCTGPTPCTVVCGANSVLNTLSCTCQCLQGFVPITGSNPFACGISPVCPPSAICGANAVLNSSCQCQCLPGFVPVANTVPLACTPQVIPPVCTNCFNGTCIGNNVCQCPSGFILVNGFCVPVLPVPPVCTSCFNGTCIANNVCQCPSGFVLVNGFCVPVSPVPPVCTNCFNGTCVANNVCQCPSGFTLSNGFCVPTSVVPPVCTNCFNGTCLVNNVCQCPSGFTLANGFCIPPGGVVPPPISGGGVPVQQYSIYALIATLLALVITNVAAIVLRK